MFTNFAEQLGNVAGSVAKTTVGIGSSVFTSVTGGGKGGAVSAPECFDVIINRLTVTQLGDVKEVPSAPLLVTATVREADFSQRAAKAKSTQPTTLGAPLALTHNRFTLTASLTSQAASIEVWADHLVDQLEGACTFPLAPLAALAGDGVGKITMDVFLTGDGATAHTMLGPQHGRAGFAATANVTLIRTQPSALIYAAPASSCPQGGEPAASARAPGKA